MGEGPGAQGAAVAAELSFPWFDSSTPATKASRDAIAKYAPNLGNENGPTSSYSWVAAKLFEQAVANAGPGAITADSLKQGLYRTQNEPSAASPVRSFAPGTPGLINCGFTVGLKDRKFTEPDGLHTSCAPDAVVNAILVKLVVG